MKKILFALLIAAALAAAYIAGFAHAANHTEVFLTEWAPGLEGDYRVNLDIDGWIWETDLWIY